MAGKERRKGGRTRKQVAFQFKTMDANGNNNLPLAGTLLDYSIAGIRFMTGEQLRKNTALLIELDFEGFGKDTADWRQLWQAGESSRLKVIGSVMWCLESKQTSGLFEVGTRFVSKAPDA
jgi:hypothetical protein